MRSTSRRTASRWSGTSLGAALRHLPDANALDVVKLVPAAFGIFFLTLADQILTARAFAGKRREYVDASQELLAMSVASAASGISQGFPIGGSNSRTAVNDGMGGAHPGVGPHRRRDRDPDPALPHRADLESAEDRCSVR